MEQRTFYVDMEPIAFKPDTILFENAFPNEKKEINIYIDDNKKIILESTIENDSGLYDINIIEKFNVLKELGHKLFDNLNLIENKYALISYSPLTYSGFSEDIIMSQENYLLNPYLNESCLKILKKHFISSGYPYLPKNIVINLSKSNNSYTFKLDITFFVYYCISIYVISETYFYILHNKENEIKKLLPLYVIDNINSNKDIMNLCTRGIMILINAIDNGMNYNLSKYSYFSVCDNFIGLDYYENKLKMNYEYNPSTDEYINKNKNTMKRNKNKLTDTYYIKNFSYNEYKPIELLSTFIIKNKQTYNNIVIPTYNHLKLLISNPSKKAGYHYCKSCHNSFFGTGKECNNCNLLILKENRKKNSDNKRYDKITKAYNLLKNLTNTGLLTPEESTYINSISNISIFKKIYTKNKDMEKIDNLLRKY